MATGSWSVLRVSLNLLRICMRVSGAMAFREISFLSGPLIKYAPSLANRQFCFLGRLIVMAI